MVNQELIDLCRTVVAAIQDTDSFEKAQLRKILLHIIPQLLTEIEILGGVLGQMLDRKDPPEHAGTEQLEAAAEKVVAERVAAPGQKKSARKKHKKRRRK